MAEMRDKGTIPLDKPDAKIAVALDPATGQAWAVAIDLAAKRYALWNQAQGWVKQRERYGTVDLTGWQLLVQDGQAKLFWSSWAETSPDGKAHLGVLALAQIS